MKRDPQSRLRKLEQQLEPGERIEALGRFRCIGRLVLYVAVALLSLVAVRLLIQRAALVMIANLVGMWMMVEAAQTLHNAQNSSVVVTNLRTFGQAGGKDFDLPHGCFIPVLHQRILFLDSGEPHSSVALRGLANAGDVLQALERHRS